MIENYKKTTLYNRHVELGAKMVPFADFLMPLKYQSEIKEHNSVRTHAGIFDVSHMGEIRVSGKRAIEFCQKITCNDVNKLVPGKIQYTVIMNESGGAIDDATICMIDNYNYLFVVNASNIKKNMDHFLKYKINDVDIIDESPFTDLIAIQGQSSQKILQKIVDIDLKDIKYFTFKETEFNNKKVVISRTGYTGEDGFEIIVDPSNTVLLWDSLLTVGAEDLVTPVGLSARDTLRLEMGYILYGNDLNDLLSPIQANIKWVVKEKKGNFLGKKRIEDEIVNGVDKKLYGLKMVDKAIPRPHCDVFYENIKIGETTSGTFSPFLKIGIALAYLNPEFAVDNRVVDIEIRGDRKKAVTLKPPFINK